MRTLLRPTLVGFVVGLAGAAVMAAARGQTTPSAPPAIPVPAEA